MDPIIFINITEMAKYAGPEGRARSGFRYVASHGYGNEMLNFKSEGGKCYGTAPFPHGSIKIEKLGAPKGKDSISGVLVIWVARSRIVGWYKNATVYRHNQRPLTGSSRSYRGRPIGYRAVAAKSDCHLIEREARELPVPRAWKRKHAMGRLTWFAEGEANRLFRAKVRRYVAADGDIAAVVGAGRRRGRNRAASPHQPDPKQRAQVERVAVKLVTRYFESLGYDVNYVGGDNLGWDLNARHRFTGTSLKLEVKGLSGSGTTVELTPNEFAMMKKHRDAYRICVVRSCLGRKPKQKVFAYNEAMNSWTDEEGGTLGVKRMTAARLHLP
jgi:hypothetical protein